MELTQQSKQVCQVDLIAHLMIEGYWIFPIVKSDFEIVVIPSQVIKTVGLFPGISDRLR